MDAVLLSRIQFGLTAGFHFLYPPLTLGLTLIIVMLETLHLAKKEDMYRMLSSFLVKILGLVFVMGVATGIVLEFSFGTNWSQYSRLVGDIFGAPLAAEAIFSFFMESAFLGVLIFGREKVSARFYWLSAFLVFFASHLSGFWIIAANSWMQTPAGFDKIMVDGALSRVVMTDFSEALFNGSTVIRYLHVVLAGWVTGSLFTAAIAAWYLLKNRDTASARTLLKMSLAVFIASSIAQLGSGHSHSVQVAKTQPVKMAAFEALWEGREGAPLALFGIPVESRQATLLEIAVPKLLSVLIHFDADARVAGLNDFPADERPPVLLPYLSYHAMIGLGMLFIALSGAALFLMITGGIYRARWFLTALVVSAVLPHVANQTGWISAEVGRQPWAVYGLLKTSQAASVVVPAWQIGATIALFGAIYLLLFAVFLKVLFDFIKAGPDSGAGEGY